MDVSFSKDHTILGSHIKYKSFEDLKERQGKLYDTIRYIDCSNCKLKELPKLPNALEVLICNNNELTELPIMPFNLKTLYCTRNNLLQLPELPDQLTVLWCQFNKLKYLPKLPPELYTLICDCNNLEKFPEVSYGIQTLHCSYNNIKVLPYSHDIIHINNIGSLRINNNPISDIIDKKYKGNLRKYMKDKKAVDDICEWFMDCKYNPRYKYCRDRLKNECDSLYN